jgi:argininosuccinate lyase
VITYDVPLEVASILSSLAIRIGALLQDVHTQYHQTRPWLLLDAGSTYTSSAMPQKRNPGVIMTARQKASDVVAASQFALFRMHNVTPGMTDYKQTGDASNIYVLTVEMLQRFDGVMEALSINGARALEELEDDWTTSMELAETLQRLHAVPFRVGHSFASDVVTYARANGLKPKQFPYAEAVKIYAAAATKYKLSATNLPLDEATFRATLSPENMVRTRVGIGGPQPAEVQRMVAAGRKALEADMGWLEARDTQPSSSWSATPMTKPTRSRSSRSTPASRSSTRSPKRSPASISSSSNSELQTAQCSRSLRTTSPSPVMPSKSGSWPRTRPPGGSPRQGW